MYARAGEDQLCHGLVASQRYTNLIEGYFKSFFGIRFVWFSSVFLFSGGGVRIFLSMLFSLISDVVPSHLRYVPGRAVPEIANLYRSRLMYLYPSISAISGLSAPFTGAWLMDVNIWRPFQLAVGVSLLSLPILFHIPERWTPNSKKHDTLSSTEATSLGYAPEEMPNDYAAVQQEDSDGESDRRREYSRRSSELYSPQLLLCYSMFFLKRLGFMSYPFVYQFASRALHWPLRRTTILQISEAVGSTLANMILIPSLSTYILNFQITTSERLDWSLVCVNSSILAISFIVLWLGRTPFFFIAGMTNTTIFSQPNCILTKTTIKSVGDYRDRIGPWAGNPGHRGVGDRQSPYGPNVYQRGISWPYSSDNRRAFDGSAPICWQWNHFSAGRLLFPAFCRKP